MLTFLDFAVGATKCLEILHHENHIVHGELRGDAFHFNLETGAVKMINFGSGARSFENGLTSAGWSLLSREVGVEHKLQFIAPEQTGRLPAEPDSRTDIYSLGILFWTMLSGEVPFPGLTALDVMQNVLSRRIPPISSKRMDVPDCLSAVIQRMTSKNIEDRYHSTSGLKHDLVQIQKLLFEGDTDGLKNFKIGTRDVSCFFHLPLKQIGRDAERKTIVKVIENVSKQLAQSSPIGKGLSLSSSSTYSDPRMETNRLEDIISDSTSSKGSESRVTMNSAPVGDSTRQLHRASQDSTASEHATTDDIPDNRPYLNTDFSTESRHTNSILDGSVPGSRYQSSGSTEGSGSLLRGIPKMKRRIKCEVITVSGSAGVGKTNLIQSIQTVARASGYVASAKFDQGKRTPFDPMLRLMSSLFRQLFSESNISSDFHNIIRSHLSPVWKTFHTYLDLPEWLLATGDTAQTPQQRDIQMPKSMRRASSPALHCGSAGNTAADWLRSGGSSKSSRFVNTYLDILRLFATYRPICFCVEDIQYADSESCELIQNIVAGKIPLVLILTYRDETSLAKEFRSLIPASTKILVSPFTEEETADYVSETLHRDRDYCLPLVAVIQEKTSGNPFFIREFLDTCHRKKCVFYSWKNNAWEFDLDKVFAEFESQTYGSQINNDFITKRLEELPSSTRSLLAWASLLGNTVSFSLVKKLLDKENSPDVPGIPTLSNSQDAVLALQGAVGAYILMMAGEDEDRFRFAHDRYMQAAGTFIEVQGYDKAVSTAVTVILLS